MNANTTLIHISSVAARFIRVGEIIERGGHLIEITSGPRAAWDRVWMTGRDLDNNGAVIDFSVHRDVMVATYDEMDIPA